MVKELIKIKTENDQQFVLARDLYKALEVKTRFSKWVDQNFKYFEEGTDYEGVLTRIPYNQAWPGKFQELQDYAITIDMAKELCMMNRTHKGKEIHQYFIEVEKDQNNQQTIVERPYKEDHSSTKSRERTMNETDNKIRVFGKDGERYVIVNDLLKAQKAKDLKAWLWRHEKDRTEISFYNGVYLITQNKAKEIIGKRKALSNERKEALLSQLNRARVLNIDDDILETEKYEYVLLEDTPFLSKDGIDFFTKRKKLTYCDLLKKAGMSSSSSLSRYFNGSKKFNLPNLKKIAQVLGTTVSMIVIPADDATDEMKVNYQQAIAYDKERKAMICKNKESDTPRTILNVTKEATVAALNKIDEVAESMKEQFEVQQEQLKILQAQLEDINHESAYLREALTDNSKTSEEDQ